jgi:hypothetical protein
MHGAGCTPGAVRGGGGSPGGAGARVLGTAAWAAARRVEREVGAAKRRTRGKLTNNPEVIALQLDLDERALQRVALELGVELDEDGGTGGDASAALVYGYGADRTGAVGVRDVGCAIRPETWAAIKVNRCCWLVGFLAPAWGCCRLLPPPHTHTGRGTAWSPGQRVLGR